MTEIIHGIPFFPILINRFYLTGKTPKTQNNSVQGQTVTRNDMFKPYKTTLDLEKYISFGKLRQWFLNL